MANTLKLKRSAVQNKVPLTTDLQLGELAINTYDGKLYLKKDNGTESIVEVGAGAGVTSFNTRTGAVTLSSNDVTTALTFTPANATHTHAASDITSGVLATARLGTGTANSTTYLRGDGTWAVVVSGNNYTVATTAPASPSNGDRWFDTNNGVEFVYINDGNTSQWVDVSGGIPAGYATESYVDTAVANAKPAGSLLYLHANFGGF